MHSILVAEDQADIRDLIVLNLRQAGYAVTAVADGQAALDSQAERASVFFARVGQLGGNDDRLLNDFLPKPAPAGVPLQEKPAPPKARYRTPAVHW